MTLRLVLIALENWRELDGYAVAHNIGDLRVLPLDRFCNFVYWYATRNYENEADKAKFDARLWQPPAGEVGQGPWSAEAETAGLGALKAALAGK